MKEPSDILSDIISTRLDAVLQDQIDNNDRSQQHFHPSSIGYCPRKTVMERLKVPVVLHNTTVQSIFNNGHYVHERIQKELKDAHIMVEAEMPVSCPEHNMFGSTDGVGVITVPDLGGVMVIIEIKSCGANSWRWMMGSPGGKYPGAGPDKKHVWQVQLYMYMTGLNYAVLIYENKNTQERAYFVIKRDLELIKNILLPRVDLINSHVDAGTLPPRDKDHQDPDKDGKTPMECNYCSYSTVCKAQEVKQTKGEVIDLIALGTELLP